MDEAEPQSGGKHALSGPKNDSSSFIQESIGSLRLFYSYANEDEQLRRKLEKHLELLQRQGYITGLHKGKIEAGIEQDQEIRRLLNTAQIILLLISSDFLASDYCYSVEMMQAIARHKSGEARVIPIILRSVDYENTPFSKLQVLPTGGKPVTSWNNRDEAFADIAREIRRAVISLVSLPLRQIPLFTAHSREDWGEAASDIGQFYGREREYAELNQWIVGDRCRLIALLGIGGIGKTTLAHFLAQQIKGEFTYIYWRSLQNAPPLQDILKNCLLFLSNQQLARLPEDVNSQITMLMEYLQKHRCLLILDNFNGVLQPGYRVGRYLQGYEGYGKLLEQISQVQHQSCLLLTSREKPTEIAHLEGDSLLVRSSYLSGMGLVEGHELLKNKGLVGADAVWTTLVQLYSGNPLALKLVAIFIWEVFNGDIDAFLKEEEAIFGEIYDLLDQQLERLSKREREILYWLAIEREAVSIDDLQGDIIHPVAKRELFDGLESLLRRSMIEKRGGAHFTLQPVIMEHITNRIVVQACEEVNTEIVDLLTNYSLIKAQAKDYLRNSQVKLILGPVAEWLLTHKGKERSEEKLRRILSNLHETYSEVLSYTIGNIINLLVQLQCGLQGYDFSHQVIRQAYLQGIALQDTNFSSAHFVKSVFNEVFGNILSVALSTNKNLLAAGTATGDILLWQVPDGTPLLTFHRHTDWVRSVAFSPDGKTIVSGSDDRTVCLWEVESGQCLKVLQGHTNWVRSVAFSPDGKTIVSGGQDQTMRLWEVSSGQCLKVLQSTEPIWSVAFSLDGKTIVSGSDDRMIRLWEVESGQCLKILQGHADQVRSVAFSPGGKTIASGSDDRTVRLWEVESGQCLKVLQGHAEPIWSVAFSLDGKTIASGSDDRTVRLWEVDSGLCFQVLQGHTNRVRSVAFSPDGKTIASGGEDQAARLWEVGDGRCLKLLQGYTYQVLSIAFNSDGSLLTNGTNDRTVGLWEVESGQRLKVLQGHTNWVRSVAFSPDGKTIASSSEDQTVRLWEVDSGLCFQVLQGHTDQIWSVAFSPDGALVASGSHDRTIRLWEVGSSQCLHVLQGHADQVRSVTFSPDGALVASGSEDQTIRLWEVKSGQCLKILQGHTDRVWTLSFNRDGTLMASGSQDQTVCLWEVKSGQLIQVLKGHTDQIWSVAFSPDGALVASGSHDRTIRLWEVGSGQCLHVLRGHTDRVRAVAFHPDSSVSLMASSSNDGTIRFWETQKGIPLQILRSDRLYERMNITNIIGLTKKQEETLKALGAIDDKER